MANTGMGPVVRAPGAHEQHPKLPGVLRAFPGRTAIEGFAGAALEPGKYAPASPRDKVIGFVQAYLRRRPIGPARAHQQAPSAILAPDKGVPEDLRTLLSSGGGTLAVLAEGPPVVVRRCHTAAAGSGQNGDKRHKTRQSALVFDRVARPEPLNPGVLGRGGRGDPLELPIGQVRAGTVRPYHLVHQGGTDAMYWKNKWNRPRCQMGPLGSLTQPRGGLICTTGKSRLEHHPNESSGSYPLGYRSPAAATWFS